MLSGGDFNISCITNISQCQQVLFPFTQDSQSNSYKWQWLKIHRIQVNKILASSAGRALSFALFTVSPILLKAVMRNDAIKIEK